MPEIDGVQVVPTDDQAEHWRKRAEQAWRDGAELLGRAHRAERRLERVRNMAKELRTTAPHIAVLIEGAIER